MKASFLITVQAGPKTKTHVDVSTRSVNPKVFFRQGQYTTTLTDEHIADWLASSLAEALEKFKESRIATTTSSDAERLHNIEIATPNQE